jgi:site-specific DNA recombinase
MHPDSSTPRAAIYTRVSTTAQGEDGSSLATQEAACRAYAAERGYTVLPSDVYREVHTGTELWERPSLAELRDAIRRRAVDVVIAFAIDRLSRDPVHLGVILSEADHKGVTIAFVSEPFDDSPEGALIRFVRGYAARIEHEKIRERAIRGRRARAESGRLIPASRPLYGYQWDAETRGRYVPNPATAPVVQRIFRRACEGASLRQIARELDELGIPTPTGIAHWRRTTIHRMLKEPLYTGVATAWRGEIALPEGTVTPLVDLSDWDTVQARLRMNQERNSGRPAKDPERALLRGGLARCAVCERSLSVATVNGGLSYICTARDECAGIPSCRVDKLDAAMWNHALAILQRDDIIAEAVEALRTQDPTISDMQALERHVADATRERENFLASIGAASDPDTIALLTQHVERISATLRQLAREREDIDVRRAQWEAAQSALDDLIVWRRRVAANAQTVDYAGRRIALQTLGLTAYVNPVGIEPRIAVELRKPFDELFPELSTVMKRRGAGTPISRRFPGSCSMTLRKVAPS